MKRLTRHEAAEFIGCSLSKLHQLEKAELLDGTYYEIGNGERRKRIYISERLEEWLLKGGEPTAWERKAARKVQFQGIQGY